MRGQQPDRVVVTQGATGHARCVDDLLDAVFHINDVRC